MTDSLYDRAKSFAKFMSELPREEIERVNAQQREEASRQHAEFSAAFRTGRCSFCGDVLTTFDPMKPCRHWLLKPDGVRKKNIETLLTDNSLSVIENYLRWVANEEAFAQNINDLSDEGNGKLVELTIKHGNLEWSFSCGETDLAGHESSFEQSRNPHWHFQMYADGKPFISYNDFHLPLSEADAGMLELTRTNPNIRYRVFGGEGMSEILGESMLEHIVTTMRSGTTDDEAENAPIKLDTFIQAAPGTTMRGEDIYRLIQEAEAEGVTATSKLRQLQNTTMQTFVSAGPGVVAKAPRNRRKKRKDSQLLTQDRAWREQQKKRGK